MEFIQSRFYKWTRAILWIAALIGIGLSQTLALAVVWLAAALAYTVVPALIARGPIIPSGASGGSAPRGGAGERKGNSEAIAYLRTLFEDIAHINEVSGEYGNDFFLIGFTLSNQGDSSAELMLGKSYSETIQIFKELFVTDPDNEVMKKNYRETLCYERNGYIAKNASFKEELLGKSVGEFTRPDWYEDEDAWFSISLHSFSSVMALQAGQRDAVASAICELAREQNFKVQYDTKRRDGKRVVGIAFN